MTYIPKHVFRGGDELPPEIPSPTPEEWDAFMSKLEDDGYLASYRRFIARNQDDDQDEGEYDPADQLERDIQ